MRKVEELSYAELRHLVWKNIGRPKDKSCEDIEQLVKDKGMKVLEYVKKYYADEVP